MYYLNFMRKLLTAQSNYRFLLLTAVLAVLGNYIYTRVVGEIHLLRHLPSHPYIPFAGGNSTILFADELKYCEEVILDHHSGTAILSCDPGRGDWNTVLVSKLETMSFNKTDSWSGYFQ